MGRAAFCSAQSSNRTKINVVYEYQLEVEDTLRAGSTQDVLTLIDGGIVGYLQGNLPEQSSSGPLVKFNQSSSEIFSACFTDNDECSLVRSSIEVSIQGEKPELAVEFVTLQLVQKYLEKVTTDDNHFIATYKYPTMVSSLAEFKMYAVADTMTDTEIAVVQKTFNEVFGAIVFAMEGDTEIVDAKFLYQDLLDVVDAVTGSATILYTQLRISGYCRNCVSDDFEAVIVDVINSNLPAFQNKLKVNANAVGSAYFDGVSSIAYSVPVLPDPLPPVKDASIFDETPPEADNKQPWFLWFGLSMAILVLCAGCYMVYNDNRVYEKDAISTSDSSQPQDSEFVSEGDVEGSMDADDEEYQAKAGDQADEADSNYEVYVF